MAALAALIIIASTLFLDIPPERLRMKQAIRSLDGRPDGRTIPIIAMTANAFAGDVHAAKTAGMNKHFAKPLDLNTLAEILKKWIP